MVPKQATTRADAPKNISEAAKAPEPVDPKLGQQPSHSAKMPSQLVHPTAHHTTTTTVPTTTTTNAVQKARAALEAEMLEKAKKVMAEAAGKIISQQLILF